MKIKWNVIGIVLIITAVLIMQIPVPEADASSASDFKMDGSTLIGYTGTATDVSVPSTVKVIGEGAFQNNTTITRVTIPKNVERIDPYAFWGCDHLEQVNLGEGLYEVGDYAFANCPELRTISFPDNITRIGISAFADCVSLRNIRIPYTVRSVHDTAFDGCYRLEIAYDAGTEGERFALYFAEKRKEMPEYEDIDEYEEVVTPPTPAPLEGNETAAQPDSQGDASGSFLENILGCINGITDQPSFNVPGKELGTTTVVGNMAVVFMDNTQPNVTDGEISGIQPGGQESQSGRSSMQEYTTEKSKGTVKYTLIDGRVLADRAYYGYQNIGSLNLPEGLEEIGEFAFARSSLQEVVIPEGVSSIGYGAFYHCDSLTQVQLPATITHIAPKAFDNTAWVKQFYEQGTGDFLVAGDGILIAYKGNSTQVQVPEGIRQIGPEVFQGHTEIVSVSLPDSLEIIGEGAFENCSSLAQLLGMSGVRIIRDRAFYHCPLEWIVLPDTVESVGLGAFARESIGGVVLLQGRIPARGQELSADRRSNEGYRVNAFDGVEYVLAYNNLTGQEVQDTVLDSSQTVYKGIMGHLETDVFVTDATYMTVAEVQGRSWSDSVLVDGQSYARQGMEKMSYLFPKWQAPQGEGLTVSGDAEIQARLSPQSEGDLLQVQMLAGIGEAPELDAAYRRIYQQGIPMDTLCYTLTLYEGESGGTISRLGKQALEVTMSLPQQLQNQDLRLVTLDRNGQLEFLDMVNDGQQIQFSTDYLSVYGIYGSGAMFAQGNVVDGQVVITGYGKRDDSPDTGDFIHPKWVLGTGLMASGLAILLFQRKRRTA